MKFDDHPLVKAFRDFQPFLRYFERYEGSSRSALFFAFIELFYLAEREEPDKVSSLSAELEEFFNAGT